MKKNKKKAFTLVELLAVIVILAVILVIAIPQIMNVIKAARLSSIKDSAMLIAEQAEKDYISQQVLNKDYNSTSIPCTDVAKLNDDYASCSISYSNGIATVKLKGSANGKFANISCSGTKDNMNCKEKVALPGYTDAEEYFANLCNDTTGCADASNTNGLIKTNGTELRYRGSNPDNYVTFNGEEAGWRIVGVFDGRVKLVKLKAFNTYSWDSSTSTVNDGNGINEWSQADLMTELNGDYLNILLTENTTWYDGINNKKEGGFDYTKVLKSSAQSLIDDALWYLGGIPERSTITLEEAYTYERENTTCQASGTTGCPYNSKNDGVERTTRWQGKIGLIYPSDYGYASSNSNCQINIRLNGNCDSNWMAKYGWTISPNSSYACRVWYTYKSGVSYTAAWITGGVHPSVYLISGVQVKGTGTSGDPFIFAE